MSMDSETQKRFEEFDERLRQAEKRILATGNLVGKTGIPWLVDTQVKVDALMDSHTRLYGALQQLTESQKKTDENLNRLAATVQAFIDSMTRGGDGSESLLLVRGLPFSTSAEAFAQGGSQLPIFTVPSPVTP